MNSKSERAGREDEAALGKRLENYRSFLSLLAEGELTPALRSKEGISDLVQNTLLNACRDWGSFRGDSESALRAWLEQILINQARNLARKYRKTARRDVARERRLSEDSRSKGIASADETPSQQLMREEERTAIKAALQRLSKDDQEIVRLRHEERREFGEIAALMGRSEVAVRRLWARALARWQVAARRKSNE